MSNRDVLIVGNGVLGYSLANALLDRDRSCTVTIIGEAHRPLGATMASGAMLGCFGEVTQSLVSTSYGRTKLQMGIQASRLWPGWVEHLNDGAGADQKVTIQPGTFVIENAKSGLIDSENYTCIRATAREHDIPVQEIDPSGIPGLNPTSDGRPLRAMYLPEGSIDSHRLVAALAQRAERSGRVKTLAVSARGLKVAGGEIRGLELSDGTTVFAPHVVLAAGVGSQVVIDSVPELARRIPRLVAGMGTSLLLDVRFEPCPHVLRTPNRAFACGLHAVPRGGSLVYVGATNAVFLDPWSQPPILMDVYFLMQCALEQIHQSICTAGLVTVRVGNRPVSMDTCPLLGPTSIKGLWMLTGTYRDGLHLSPLLAMDLADRIAGGAGLVDHPFAPERRPISLRTRQQAIEDAVKHQSAVGWEHGLQLPKVGWHEMLESVMRARVEAVYGAIESEIVMPIDLVPTVDLNPQVVIPFINQYYRTVEETWR